MTRKRRMALWCLGLWSMGTLAIALVATRNFGLVDQLLDTLPNPRFAEVVNRIGSAPARELLRYLVSEVNRSLFGTWGWVQVPLGGVVVALVWPGGSRRVRWTVLSMWVLALVLTLVLTPPIVSVGRELDFVPRTPPPPALQTFGLLHASYSIAEFLKLGLGFLTAYWLVREEEADLRG